MLDYYREQQDTLIKIYYLQNSIYRLKMLKENLIVGTAKECKTKLTWNYYDDQEKLLKNELCRLQKKWKAYIYY